MSRSRRILFSSLAGLVLFLSIPALAKADPLVLTIQNPNQFATPGQTLIFSAQLTNTSTLNSNSATIGEQATSLGFVSVLAIQPFFDNNFNLQVVAVGSTLGPLQAFSVTVDPAAPLGSVITGTLRFSYSPGIQTNVANWTVTVGPAPVPEPATMLLLATGLAGALGSKRVRRRFTKS